MHFKTCRECGLNFRTANKYGVICASCSEFKHKVRIDKMRETRRRLYGSSQV